MRVVQDATQLAAFSGCALVPTMGALHEGHASLIREAAKQSKPVVVTIFVNPTQFGPREDFSKYPRTVDDDLRIAEAHGAAAVFLPSVETIYPEGMESAHAAAMRLPLPAVARMPGLEDAARPGHFAGVCQVVARLFDLTLPTYAIFGQKDWQQMRVLEEMVASAERRWGTLTMARGATLRDPDGLAMSSRNRYLRPEQRAQALGLSHALQLATTASTPEEGEALMRDTLLNHGLQIDYAVVRNPQTLLPVQSMSNPTHALIAARLDTVRLIDNRTLPARLSRS